MNVRQPVLSAMLVAVMAVGTAWAQSRPPQEPALQADTARHHLDQSNEESGTSGAGGLLSLLPKPVTTQHSITVSGHTLSYSAKAGTLDLLGGDGKTIAKMFYVAYDLKSDGSNEASGNRPITFVFNGGPGAASAYLQLGAIGPRIVKTSADGAFLPPPQTLEDNPDTWLGMTDLVFVDPVGTGYSRAAPGEKPDKFWGVQQDASAMGAFIRLYLQNANRTASPVYLAGESYGGFRAALLAKTLQEDVGISPSGIVLISPALDFSFIYGDDNKPLKWALTLPSMAAVNLESKGVHGNQLKDELGKVEHYALSDYLVALASGLKQGGAATSKKVAEFTGLPLDLVERHFARIPVRVFAKAFDRASGRVASLYDANLTAPDIAPETDRLVTPDPVLDRSIPVITSAFVHYIRDELHYRTDMSYRLLNTRVNKAWDYGTSSSRQGYADVMDDLQEARALNPDLGILIAHGFSDLVTPYSVSRYLVDQLPPLPGVEPIRLRTYEGGHMMYLRPDSRHALERDASALYRSGS